MILGFTTQIDGKSTYFVEKILLSMLPLQYDHPKYGAQILSDWTHVDYRTGFLSILNPTKTDKERLRFQEKLTYMVNDFLKPKFHTIREDKNDRWKVGTMIDFFINVRTKKMFRFAPKMPVVSTQKIEIIYTGGSLNYMSIYIDNKCYLKNYNPHQIIDKIKIDFEKQEKIKAFAINDGFNTIEDFLTYFNEDFTGKIIHWTDLRY